MTLRPLVHFGSVEPGSHCNLWVCVDDTKRSVVALVLCGPLVGAEVGLVLIIVRSVARSHLGSFGLRAHENLQFIKF